MAETGNAIISTADISDIQTRLSQVEAALGRTNLVAPVDGFTFIDGDVVDTTATSDFGIGNVKIFCRRIEMASFVPGDNLTFKAQIDLSTEMATNWKKIWTQATPVIICSDNNEWAKIKSSASVRKFSAAGTEPGKYSIVLNSDSSTATGVTYTAYVDFMAVALY